MWHASKRGNVPPSPEADHDFIKYRPNMLVYGPKSGPGRQREIHPPAPTPADKLFNKNNKSC